MKISKKVNLPIRERLVKSLPLTALMVATLLFLQVLATSRDSQSMRGVQSAELFEQVKMWPSLANETHSIKLNSPEAQQQSESPIPGKGSQVSGSLMRQVAPVFFPLDPDTGKIKLEQGIDSVVIDVGARQSDYLGVLEADLRGKKHGNKTAVFLVDPLPESVVPVTARVSQYAIQTKRWNQAFVMRAAMRKEEGHTAFQVALGPACGPILQTSSKNKFWCADTKDRIETAVFRLEDFLDLLPPQIGAIHLKVDAEGADLDVLKGAGDRITVFDTIIIECNGPNSTKTFRDGECTFEDAKAYMESAGFDVTHEDQGGLANMYFVNQHKLATLKLPSYFHSNGLTFRKFYLKFPTIATA